MPQTLSTDDAGFAELTDEQRERRVVAARAVLRQAIKLVGIERTADLLLTEAGRR